MSSMGFKVSRDYFIECFLYDVVSGDLTWKERPAHHFEKHYMVGSFNKRYSGMKIRSKDTGGYYIVNVRNTTFKAHRIIYTMCHGEIPAGMEIDHINGIRSDNRIDNLRIVSPHRNSQNRKRRSDNKTGFNGVCFESDSGKFLATVNINKKQVKIGRFNSAIEANLARSAYLASHCNHGYSCTHGIR